MTAPEPTTSETSEVASISSEIDAARKEAAPSEAPTPGLLRRIGRGLWRLVRVLLLLAILAGVGMAIYYGWPIVKERYVDPIAANTSALESTDSRLSSLEEQIAAIEAAEGELPSRLEGIEAELSALADQDQAIDDRFEAVEGMIERHTARLEALDNGQRELGEGIGQVGSEVTLQADLVRSMELLSRARLFLYQANYGLARADLVEARKVMTQVQSDSPDWEPAVVTEVIERINRSVAALPQFPVAAADDLDIAWQALLAQEVPAAPEVAPEPDAEPADSAAEQGGGGG